MSSPVTGPFVRSSDPADLYFCRQSRGWKQARPYDAVLPYELFVGTVTNGTPTPTAAQMVGVNPLDDLCDSHEFDLTNNKAYDNLKGAISERAALGVTLAEAEQSYQMIASRCKTLYRTFTNLKRGNLAGAQKELGLAIGTKKPASKALADLYLEVHFGAVPLYVDIHDAIKSIQEPIKSPWVKAKASGAFKRIELGDPSRGSNPNADWPNLLSWDSEHFMTASHDVAMGCQVKVDNPNLWLANQMGLVNPFVVAHELFPFSFVGDWFMNVGQILSAYSDFYGLGITNAWTTRRTKGHHHLHNRTTYRWLEGDGYVYSGSFQSQGGSFSQVRRTAGLTGPVFVVDGGRVWGWRRAVAAMSLVTQFFHR